VEEHSVIAAAHEDGFGFQSQFHHRRLSACLAR
jgi:hypothetical protein